MRHPNTLKQYLNMVKFIVDAEYIKDKTINGKLAIFFSTVNMCLVAVDFFKQQYPDLDVRKYTAEDPYENVIDPDIRITTILSTGTAVDIPNLVMVLNTINIFSGQANIQTLGRLRKIDNKELKYIYIYCQQIAKHNQYHRHRRITISPYALSITELNYPHVIDNDIHNGYAYYRQHN